MATEVELKLYCSPDEIARLATYPLIAAGVETGPAKRLENTCFDTPGLAQDKAKQEALEPVQQLRYGVAFCAAFSLESNR